jgi:hypothetical protein
MQTDRDQLKDLNIRIGEAESAGNAELLGQWLAPRLAFRRANGDLNDGGEFLKAVKRSPARHTEIESINILGPNRAIVTCFVTLAVDTTPNRFHNVRLFIRDVDGQWRLLGWANEPA